jgi:putative peptidoglycan lipid II flippase
LKKTTELKKIDSDGVFSNLKKVVSGTSLSRFFGLIRDIATTNLMGASVFHDIYIVCLKIPNLFRRFFAEGAFNQAFIPVYSDYYKNENNNETKEFLNAIAGALLAVSLSSFNILSSICKWYSKHSSEIFYTSIHAGSI